MNKLFLPIFVIASAFFISNPIGVSAHSGRTDAYGGHNCYVGACAGTYHYHNGGTSYRYVPPAPVLLTMPDSNLSWKYTPDSNGTFTLDIDWDRPSPGNWSITINKVPGADPGPLSDTTVSKYSFEGVSTGTWYVNIKEAMSNGYWSKVSYWTVTLPTWTKPYPSPVPSPFFIDEDSLRVDGKKANEDREQDGDMDLAILTGLVAIAGLGIWSSSRSKQNEK